MPRVPSAHGGGGMRTGDLDLDPFRSILRPGAHLVGKYGTRYTVRQVRGDRVELRAEHSRRSAWVPKAEAERRLA